MHTDKTATPMSIYIQSEIKSDYLPVRCRRRPTEFTEYYNAVCLIAGWRNLTANHMGKKMFKKMKAENADWVHLSGSLLFLLWWFAAGLDCFLRGGAATLEHLSQPFGHIRHALLWAQKVHRFLHFLKCT